MKKTYTIFACLVFSLFIAGMALAAETLDSTNDTIADGSTAASDLTGIKLSPNVSLYYIPNADGSHFAIDSFNSKGDKAYGVSSFGNGVYMKDATALDTTITAVDGTFSTWAQMGSGS